jgi:hypothetical protein
MPVGERGDADRFAALTLSHGVAHALTPNAPDFARFPQLTAVDPAAVP